MKKAIAALVGVVLALGAGGLALARSGSDSSGLHSYSLECKGEDLVLTNTGEDEIGILIHLSGGQPVFYVAEGASKNFGTPGVDTGGPGTFFEVFSTAFGRGTQFTIAIDEGTFPACSEGPTTLWGLAPDSCLDNGTRVVQFKFGNRPDLDGRAGSVRFNRPGTLAYFGPATPATFVSGALVTVPIPNITDLPPVIRLIYFINDDQDITDHEDVLTVPVAACEAAGTTTTTTVKPPAATTTTTTVKPVTPVAPTTTVAEKVLTPNAAVGFVAPGSEVLPGVLTFGAGGFAPGEQVVVTLHSTPRSLGTVTAAADGSVSVSVEVLASDGAGQHSVEFSGPSGVVSVPFTLVLPAQSLPVTL